MSSKHISALKDAGLHCINKSILYFYTVLTSSPSCCLCIIMHINRWEKHTERLRRGGCQWSEQIRMTKHYTKPRHQQASHLPVCHPDALNHHELLFEPMHMCVSVPACDWCVLLPFVSFSLPLVLSSSHCPSCPTLVWTVKETWGLRDSCALSQQPALGPLCLVFSSLYQSPTAVGKAEEMRP